MRKMKTLKEIEEILKAHKAALEEKYGVKELAIFGSFVRGEQNKRSDIDIIVEFEEVPDLLTFIALERHLQRLLRKNVDLVRKQAVREELRDRILNEMITI